MVDFDASRMITPKKEMTREIVEIVNLILTFLENIIVQLYYPIRKIRK